MSDDANTMRPDATFTSVTNAEKKTNPAHKSILFVREKDYRPDENYNPDQLKAGIEVEMEHTEDPAVARVIAKDHLDERKDYYEIVKREGL